MATKTTNGPNFSVTYDSGTGLGTVSGGNGVDTINASSNTLKIGTATTFNITGNGWTFTGGNGSDVITGSSYGDIMWGDSLGNSGINSDNGADTMYGGAGNDSMHGGNGADVLQGDAGADVLYGDRGPDVFKYVLKSDSSSNLIDGSWNSATGDWIKDFTSSEGDKIDFSALNPNGQITAPVGDPNPNNHPDKLTWGTGPAAYHVWTGGGFVYADTNGDGVADITIKVTGTVGSGDFIGVNHDPKGVNDTAALLEDTSTSGNVRTNDGDSDGDTLTYAVTNALPVAGLTFNSNGTWSFDAHDNAYQHLAAGATQVVTVNILVTDGHGGSTTETLTITITGTNDTPTVAAALTASANEGDAAFTANLLSGASDRDDGETATLTVTGVTYSVDGGPASGTAPAGVSLTGATLSVDPTNPAFDHLAAGVTQQIVVSYNVTDVHGATVAQTETITITGTNDVPTLNGTNTGTLTETNAAQSTNGTVTISDPDAGQSTYQTLSNVAGNHGYGTFSMNAAGAWTYTMNNAHDEFVAGTDYTDSVVVTSFDGTATQTITVTIHGTNDPATIAGTDTGSVTEDSLTNTASGTLTAADVDNTPNTFTAVAAGAATANHYGTFAMASDGTWTYTLDNTNATVDGLATGATLTDTFSVTSIDGTSHTVTVTINGHTDSATPTFNISTPVGADPNDFDNLTGGVSHNETTINNSNYATTGPDSITGGAASQDINGNGGDDTIYGAGGNDNISGANGNDVLYGQAGDDTLVGGNQDDTLYGGSNASPNALTFGDSLVGSGGNDLLYGGSGTDTLEGGNGTDTLIGGYGADNLTGGADSDVFKFISLFDFGSNAAQDTITDFTTTVDKIDLSEIDSGNGTTGAFAWGGLDTPTAHGIWFTNVAGVIHVYGDTDGNTSTAELAFDLTGGVAVPVQADFVL